MSIIIYRNPRCSKSGQTLQLLNENNMEPQIIEYLKTPPDREELQAILGMPALQPRQLMRKRGTEYEEAGLDNPELDYDAFFQGVLDHPRLIERPIVIKDNKAIIGRPPKLELVS